MKVLLLTLAKFFDLAAIVIIALFNSGDLSLNALLVGAVALIVAVSLRLAKLPTNVNWRQLLGVAFACGIGFTMSLFIAGLAFEHGSGDYLSEDRLGILVGSFLSALAEYVILHVSLPKSP